MFAFHLFYSLWLPLVRNYGLSSSLMKRSLLLYVFKQNLNKKSVSLLVGIINVIPNFFSEKSYLLSEKKLLLSGDIELIQVLQRFLIHLLTAVDS